MEQWSLCVYVSLVLGWFAVVWGGSISELLLQSFSFRNDLQHHRSEDPHQHLDIIYVLYIVYCVVKYLLFFVLDASY